MSDPAASWLAGREPVETPRVVEWARSAHRLALSLYATADPTPDALTTSVRGVLFRRGKVMLVRDAAGVHAMPGGRREAGETLAQTLTREVGEETGWSFSRAAPFAVIHFHHQTPRPEGYPYPYPDFFQPLYVLEAADYDRRRLVRDGWESGSRMTPVGLARTAMQGEQVAVVALALAARLQRPAA